MADNDEEPLKLTGLPEYLGLVMCRQPPPPEIFLHRLSREQIVMVFVTNGYTHVKYRSGEQNLVLNLYSVTHTSVQHAIVNISFDFFPKISDSFSEACDGA